MLNSFFNDVTVSLFFYLLLSLLFSSYKGEVVQQAYNNKVPYKTYHGISAGIKLKPTFKV